MVIKTIKNLWNNSLGFWNNCLFWNIPNVNYSRIIPGIIPGIWNNLNYSKIFELFQTSKNWAFADTSNYSTNYSSRVRIRMRALLHGKIYTHRVYIFFQRNKVYKFWNNLNYSKILSEKLQRFALTPTAVLAVIFPQGIF